MEYITASTTIPTNMAAIPTGITFIMLSCDRYTAGYFLNSSFSDDNTANKIPPVTKYATKPPRAAKPIHVKFIGNPFVRNFSQVQKRRHCTPPPKGMNPIICCARVARGCLRSTPAAPLDPLPQKNFARHPSEAIPRNNISPVCPCSANRDAPPAFPQSLLPLQC